MKNIVGIVNLAVFCCALLQQVSGASLEELTGPARAAELRTADMMKPVTEVQLKAPSPILVPSNGELRKLVNAAMDSLQPNLFVETLALYKKPLHSGHAAAWSDAEQKDLFNQMIALSTLAGIQYYSASRKTMRTFYQTSQIIDDPAGKQPLPDPEFASLPAALTLFARQKDLTFGDNTYRYNYSTAGDAIFFTQENLTSMNIGIIPAVGKNNFRSVLAVIDTGDSLLIYAVAMAKSLSLPGMGDRIGASFANRVEAVLSWFTARADTVF